MDAKEIIAMRAACEFCNGDFVNLGIGIPTMVVNYLSPGVNVTLQSENGFLGIGPTPLENEIDPDLTNAGGKPSTIMPGGAFFDSATSFGIIRGGHLSATVLGALQVDQEGNLANWTVPGKIVPGMGGAMDLVAGAKRVIIAMEHTAKGVPKILSRCTLPLTAAGEVDLIITELCVMEVINKTLVLKELAPSVCLDDVRKATEADYSIDPDLTTMSFK